MMKKVLIFIVALLALCSYGANAVENEEYEVIFVLHSRTGKYLVEDTLFGNNIIYTEKKAVKYAASRIPERFVDNSEEYGVYIGYYSDKEPRHYAYYLRCYYDYLGVLKWKYGDVSKEIRKIIEEVNK